MSFSTSLTTAVYVFLFFLFQLQQFVSAGLVKKKMNGKTCSFAVPVVVGTDMLLCRFPVVLQQSISIRRKSSHPSLYLMTASTIFFIFLVRESGFGESFSAGGRPRFFAFFTSSSLSRPRPLLELGVAGPPSWSLSLLRFLVVFLWRTSSSMSSRFPSSMAYDEEKGWLEKAKKLNFKMFSDWFPNTRTLQNLTFSHCFSVSESL